MTPSRPGSTCRAPFNLMDFVEGAVLASIDDAEAYPHAWRRPAADDLIDVMDRYAAATTRDVSDLPYYVAFARWRSACIGEGVLNRYKQAVMGDIDFDIDAQAESVERSVLAAREALDQLR